MNIHAVTLVVPDYDEGLAFYVDKLGFECRADQDLGGGKRWVMVAPPGTETALLLAQAKGSEQEAAIGNQAGGRVSFFLHSDDFMTDFTRMKAAGVHFEEDPRHESYGSVAVFQDPFGNRWDLLQLK
ncbi:MAG: VOC family protein [Pseudomonadota bacterium]